MGLRDALFVVLVGASFVLHVCFASGIDGSFIFEATEVAQERCLRCCFLFRCFLIVCPFFLIVLLVSVFVCLYSFGVELRFLCELLSWFGVCVGGSSFCVVGAMLVMESSS